MGYFVVQDTVVVSLAGQGWVDHHVGAKIQAGHVKNAVQLSGRGHEQHHVRYREGYAHEIFQDLDGIRYLVHYIVVKFVLRRLDEYQLHVSAQGKRHASGFGMVLGQKYPEVFGAQPGAFPGAYHHHHGGFKLVHAVQVPFLLQQLLKNLRIILAEIVDGGQGIDIKAGDRLGEEGHVGQLVGQYRVFFMEVPQLAQGPPLVRGNLVLNPRQGGEALAERGVFLVDILQIQQKPPFGFSDAVVDPWIIKDG